MATRKKATPPPTPPPKQRDLLSMVAEDLAAGVDSTVAEVVTAAGYRLRLERVNSMAPMLQGVSALFMVLPQSAAEPKPAQGLLSDRDAAKIAGIMQAVLLEAVTGTRGDESEPWKPVRLVATKAQQDPAAGRVWVGVLKDADQMRCYDALVKLHTGEGMATLIATAFRLAADLLAPALVGIGVRLRSMDGRAVES